MKRKHKIPDISLLIMAIWFNSCMANANFTVNSRSRREIHLNPHGSEMLNGHFNHHSDLQQQQQQHQQQYQHQHEHEEHEVDEMMFNHHLEQMVYNMRNGGINGGHTYNGDDMNDFDGGLGGLLPHELPEHDHIAHHLAFLLLSSLLYCCLSPTFFIVIASCLT
uniref:Uncharacterized protein n=1 Tax=Glossina brevipalpis TaxID=37001 RepID=A0A1A9W2W8_9MUSC